MGASEETNRKPAFLEVGSKLNHQDNMDRRFLSFFLFTRVPFWVPIFDPQPSLTEGQLAPT